MFKPAGVSLGKKDRELLLVVFVSQVIVSSVVDCAADEHTQSAQTTGVSTSVEDGSE